MSGDGPIPGEGQGKSSNDSDSIPDRGIGIPDLFLEGLNPLLEGLDDSDGQPQALSGHRTSGGWISTRFGAWLPSAALPSSSMSVAIDGTVRSSSRTGSRSL